jgi:hypothetical protein
VRGLKKRMNSPDVEIEPTSLPFARLQGAQAYARLSSFEEPPCFKLVM